MKGKNVFILRGCPGCGKTTLAEELCNNNRSSVICSADDYFMVDDEYKWDAEKIHLAHLWCQQLFKENLKDGTEIIVVANTNTTTKDVNTYRDIALEYGYKVFVTVVENYHNGVNTHNVPKEILEKMENTIKQNIKLT